MGFQEIGTRHAAQRQIVERKEDHGTLQSGMAYGEHIIHIHPQAPNKVPVGAACNGCGVCCLFEPCPLGMLISRGRTGACSALRWDDTLTQYRCGAIVAPQDVLVQSLPRVTRWLAIVLVPLLRRLGLRWIAAGSGCDSSLEVLSGHHNRPNPDRSGVGSTTMPPSELPTEIRAVARHSRHD